MGRRHKRVLMGMGEIVRGTFSCRGGGQFAVAVRFGVADLTFVARAHSLLFSALFVQCFAMIAPRPFDSDFLVCIVKLITFAACTLVQARLAFEFPHLLVCVF